MTTQGEKTAVSPSTSKATPASTTTNLPCPRYFVARDDGTLTPLIAVDELPTSIIIVGVSATISQAETVSMISLGVESRSPHKYIVENFDRSGDSNPVKPTPQTNAVRNAVAGNSGISQTPLEASSNPIGSNSGISERQLQDSIAVVPQDSSGVVHDAGGAVENASDDVKGPSSLIPEEKVGLGGRHVEEWRQGVKNDDIQVNSEEVSLNFHWIASNNLKATIDAIANQNVTEKPPSSTPDVVTPDAVTPGPFGKKVYCTHWIRWGECDYTQQGCLYKHEMPDEPTLNSIGIRTIPKWYRDVNAPKTGWTERPPPANQVWRGKPDRPAQPPQPVNLFPVPGRLVTVPLHNTARVPQTNAPFTHQPNSSRLSNAFGNGRNIVEQHSPAPYKPRHFCPSTFGNSQNIMEQRPQASYRPYVSPGSMLFSNGQNVMGQRTSATPSVTTNKQSNYGHSNPSTTSRRFFVPGPRHLQYNAPHDPTRNHDLYNLPPALAPSYRPLQPSVDRQPTAAPSMLAPPTSSTASATYFEPQTPAPQHRRMFVPAGEAVFVTNPIPADEVRANPKGGKKHGKGRRVANGNGSGENTNGGNGNGGNRNGTGGNGNDNGNGNGNGNGGNASALRDLLLDFD